MDRCTRQITREQYDRGVKNRGYVVSKTEFTQVKSQARIFDDFNEARRYKTMFGGKVIKL